MLKGCMNDRDIVEMVVDQDCGDTVTTVSLMQAQWWWMNREDG
jgi:hypothetical protein